MRVTIALVSLGLAASAQAVPITYAFSGAVTSVDGEQAMIDWAIPGLTVGSSFFGAATYDPEVSATQVRMSLSVAGNVLAPDGSGARLSSRNDSPDDAVFFTMPAPWATGGAYPVGGSFRGELMRITLQDITGTALTTDQLPLDLASAFPDRRFSFLGSGVCDTQLCASAHSFFINWQGEIQSMAVPEPSTLLLLTGALAGIAVARRKRVK